MAPRRSRCSNSELDLTNSANKKRHCLNTRFPFGTTVTCGLYYKPMTIVNDDSRVVKKLEASLTDNDRVVIYDRHMFIRLQATGLAVLGVYQIQIIFTGVTPGAV